MSKATKIASKRPKAKKANRVLPAQRREPFKAADCPVNQITHLQRTIGNQAVQRLFKSGNIQAKLKIGKPNDKYEQEADRVADIVMRMPESNSPTVAKTGFNVESSINSLKGGGQPLSKSVRNYFEPRFVYDFSGVRVHTNGEANEAARSIDARAFTIGNNIVFNRGAYSPETSGGKRLLAHELTHTIQQRNKDIPIQRWGPSIHEELTEEGINGIRGGLTDVDEEAVNTLANYATQMDLKLPELWFNFIGKLKGSGLSLRSKERRIEALQKHYAANTLRAKNHGEGGLYIYSESKASGINIIHQKIYEKRAQNSLKEIPLYWNSITECENNKIRLRNKVFEILGDALHVAQDRGSHGEGAAGKGHAGEVLTGKSPDKPKNNPEGYRKAQQNTTYLLIGNFDILTRLLNKEYRSKCSTIGPAEVEIKDVE